MAALDTLLFQEKTLMDLNEQLDPLIEGIESAAVKDYIQSHINETLHP